MSFFQFENGDVLRNFVKTYPQFDVVIYGGLFYHLSIAKVEETPINPHGLSSNPYPFIIKGNNLVSFKTVSSESFHEDFGYGNVLTGTVYPHSATIRSEFYATDGNRPKIDALQNTFDFYQKWSSHFAYNSSLGNKASQALRLISIPAVYFGSGIKKGTVSLKFFITGTLAGELVDDKQNGELRQLSPRDANSGSVAGVVLHNEGCVLLTGSWAINSAHTETYDNGNVNPRWLDFAFTGSTAPSSSFSIHFSGTQKIPILTMKCYAPKGQLNFSNNPTFIQFNQSSSLTPLTGTREFKERTDIILANIKKSNFIEPTGSFEKITYISKIKIYDKDKNVIAIAQMAQPVRKREKDDFVFKIPIDL